MAPVRPLAFLDPLGRRAMAWLALLAFALYLPLIGWGLPYATTAARTRTLAVDELLPLEALGEMRNTFGTATPDRNYGYPWWHYFALAAVQAPYVGYLKLTGALTGAQAGYPFGLKDPVSALRDLTLIGRALSVVMGAGIVALSYAFARTLWEHRTGVLAAAITLLAYPQVYYSRVGNPDVALVFWSAFGLVAFASILREGVSVRRCVAFGLAAGLAMGAKDQGLVVFLPLALALLLPRVQQAGDARFAVKPLALGLAAACASYAIATGMIVDPKRHLLHVYYLFFQQSGVTWMPFYHPPLPRTPGGIAEMLAGTAAGLSAMSSLPVLAAASVGAVLAWRRDARYLVLLLPIPVLFLLLTLPTGAVVYRYYYPLSPIVAAFAASALVWLGAAWSRNAMVLGIAVVLGWQGLVALDLSYAQWHETRQVAGEWFRRHAAAGDVVEYFGVEQYLPPLPAQIATRRIAGRESWKGETGHGGRLLGYLEREGPRYVYVTPDHSSQPGMEYSGDCPPEVYEALMDGSAGYRLAAYFPTPTLMPRPFERPRLDYPSVSPPVRIFERVQENPH
jgi:hypothetical protein